MNIISQKGCLYTILDMLPTEEVYLMQVVCKRFYTMLEEYIRESPIRSMDFSLYLSIENVGTFKPS